MVKSAFLKEIAIDEIPEEGMNVEADKDDQWLLNVVEEVYDGKMCHNEELALILTIHKFDKNINLSGEFIGTLKSECDRCLVEFEERISVPISVTMAPLYENERAKEKEKKKGVNLEVVLDDEDFSYYEGDIIELSDLIREQLIVDAPMQRLCNENCAGLCGGCGQNLNQGKCKCSKEDVDPRWAALKTLKIKK